MNKSSRSLGTQKLDRLAKTETCSWLADMIDYHGDSAVIKELSSALKQKNYTWKVYGGCWCSDTRQLLPLFHSVIKYARFPEEKIEYYFLDMNKKSPKGEEVADKVNFVPTFILYENGKEKGRITESISQPMESELLTLVRLP